MIEEILKLIEKSIEGSGKTKKFYYEGLKMSGTGFSQSMERKTLTLNNFIKLCELLQLEPSTFFFKNSGNIQSAVNSKNVNQTNGINDVENALLKQENLHLKEKVELLERLIKSYQNN